MYIMTIHIIIAIRYFHSSVFTVCIITVHIRVLLKDSTFSYLNQISMIMYYFMIIFLGISSVQGCVPIPPSPPSPQDSLPSLTSVDPNEISVGGFSSGASFATQVINCRNDYIVMQSLILIFFFLVSRG